LKTGEKHRSARASRRSGRGAASKDVKQVHKVVAAKFGKVLHASVSHDWALCTAYHDESDISVVLHRTAAGWTIANHDGGAFDTETLKKLGVPPADTAPLLKAYQ
jgi:hypothetical protein